MVTVAEAVVGDETGVAKLVFRNGKIYDYFGVGFGHSPTCLHTL